MALVLLASTRDKVITLTVKEGELRLEASSALGKVRDVVKFPGHPEVSVECNPEQLAKSLPHIETLGIVGGSCVLLRGSRFTHVISTIQEAAAAPEEEEEEEKGEGKRRAGDADKKGKNRSGN